MVRLPKVIEHYILSVNANTIEHALHGVAHRTRTTHIELNVFGCLVVFKISIVHHFVHKSRHVWHSCLVGFGVWAVECEVEMEVGIFLFQLVEVFQEERLAKATGTIEVVHLAIAYVQRLEQVHNLTAKRCHTSTATNPNHLFL